MSAQQTLQALSSDTVNLIGSCQVITSVFSVVKELTENSLDAGASSVDVKLEDYGLTKIEVCDNGSGIKPADVPFMAKRHFTSKISRIEDLNLLTTYGFRGEALGSLCAVSQVTITTKTAEDQLSYVYTVGSEGDVLDKKPSHNGKGTIVSAKNLFHNVPVRKQYYSNNQRRKDDLKRIEHLLMVYAVVRPELRITFKHSKEYIFQKTALKDMKSALNVVLGRQVVGQLLHMEKCTEENKVLIWAFLPKPGSDVKEMSLASTDKTFVAVNKRPVSVPEFNKILRNYYSNCHGLESYRYPVCFVCLDIPTNQIDVNVDPNKTKVFFQEKMEVQNALEEILVELYGPLENVPSWHYREANGDVKPSKGKVVSDKEKEKVVCKPLITYSKRPGDDDLSDGLETSNISTVSALSSSSKKEIRDENKNTLPSFSLTFHSDLLDNSNANVTASQPNVQKMDNSLDIQMDSTTNGRTEIASPSTIPIPLVEPNLTDQEIKRNSNSNSQTLENESQLQDVTVKKGCETAIMDLDDDLLFLCEDLLFGQTSTPSLNTCPIQEVTVVQDNESSVVAGDDRLCGQEAGKEQNSEKTQAAQDSSISNINAEDWSKGNMSVGTSLLQPVKLLPPAIGQRPGKRSLSPSFEMRDSCSSQHRRKTAKLSLLTNQTTLLDVVASQIAKKPESPFSQFYKEKYPSLSQSLPEESNGAIEKRLKQTWEEMKDDDKVTYREKCWQETKKYEKDILSRTRKYEAQSMQGTELMNKKGAERVKKVLKKRLYCKERKIKIPINNIRNLKPKANSNCAVQVVGPAPNCDGVCWYCSINQKFYLFNVWRLAEVNLYKKLKSEHKLPFTPCDPIVLDSRSISERGMTALERLARESPPGCTYFHIGDERLVSNGFDVKCCFDSSGKLHSELCGICQVVPAYDLKDLKMLLEVLSSNFDASLSQSRTLKASYYLQGEAVRMTRQNLGRKSLKDVEALLLNVSEEVDKPCIHHKPIFKELLDFSDGLLDD